MVSACLSQRLSRLDLLQTFPVTFPHLLHWIAIVLDVLYLLLSSLVPLFHRLGFLIRRWFAVVQMTIMFIPITSLEFIHGIGLLDVAIHWKAPISYHFLFVVALMSDMVSGVLGFPFQPFNRHPLIMSGSVSPELVLTLPAYKMSRWHLLHYAPKVEGVGVVSNDLLAGFWLFVVCGSDGRHISLVVPMRWQLSDVQFLQRGHPLVREKALLRAFIGFQVLTITKTRSPPRCSTLELYTQERWNTQTR